MRLEVTAPPDSVLQEPLPAAVRFVNDGAETLAFPYEQSALDLTTLRLFDAQRKPIAEANGYTLQFRQGLDAIPGDPAKLMTAPLAPGESVPWSEDLLHYFTIATPGEYFLQVRFVFPPSAIEAETELVPFRVLPLVCTGFDVVPDRVAMSVLHSVVQHQDEGGRRTIVQARSVAVAATPFSGASFSGPAGIARVSEADFASRKTYENDFFRWVAWVDGRTLTLATVRDDSRSEPLALDLGVDAELAGRPVQHEDGGVTVWLLAGADLHRLDFDAAGVLIATRVAEHFAAAPKPFAAACDYGGGFLVAAAVDGAFPLVLRRFAREGTKTEVAFASPFGRGSVASVNLRLKSGVPQLLVAARLPGSVVAIAALALEGERTAWRTSDWRIDEEWVAIDVMGGASDVLHGAVMTAGGRILQLEPGAEPRPVVESADLVGEVRLAVAGGVTHLFYAERSAGLRYRWLD